MSYLKEIEFTSQNCVFYHHFYSKLTSTISTENRQKVKIKKIRFIKSKRVAFISNLNRRLRPKFIAKRVY